MQRASWTGSVAGYQCFLQCACRILTVGTLQQSIGILNSGDVTNYSDTEGQVTTVLQTALQLTTLADYELFTTGETRCSGD